LVVGEAFRYESPKPYKSIHIVPRSTVQVLFYISHGVQVPACHYECGLVKPATDIFGQPFDWTEVTDRLFTVHTSCQHKRPECAYAAVKYRDVWYYIDDRDVESKTTFTLMLTMTRMNMATGKKDGPALTLPVGR
jgi:hypothetical protein